MTLQTIQGTVQTQRFHSFVLAGLTLACGQAIAMNGAQLGGYGIKNAGMGGASIALPLDASAAANNPAGMAFVPTSAVGNVVVFKGKSNFTGTGRTLYDNTTEAGPEGGFNWVVNSQMTVGLTLSGAGAGANFGEPLVPGLGLANLKSSQKVADIIPSISWKINPNLAVGLGVIFSFQEFESQGVVAPIPVPPGFVALPNHGKEKAQGVGARIGLQWNATPELSVGATYKARTPMSKLGKYGDANNLLAYSGGKVDIPAEYGVGLAWKATPSVTLAADLLEVKYSKVKVMEDPNGQKWKDQPILRLGAAWEMNPTWTLRGGLSSNQRQITSDRTQQNILSPAINNVAYTFGASMKLDPKSDISFSMELNPSKTLNGTGPVSQGTNLTSKTQVIRVGYQKQF